MPLTTAGTITFAALDWALSALCQMDVSTDPTGRSAGRGLHLLPDAYASAACNDDRKCAAAVVVVELRVEDVLCEFLGGRLS